MPRLTSIALITVLAVLMVFTVHPVSADSKKILAAIERGEGRLSDLDVLDEHCWMMSPGHTVCALAPGAVEPLASALKLFRADFERHVTLKHCPWRQ